MATDDAGDWGGWSPDDEVLTVPAARLADQILIDGLHPDLRDAIEYLTDHGAGPRDLVAAVRLCCFRLGMAEDQSDETVRAVELLLRRLEEEDDAPDGTKEEEWTAD